MESFSPYRLEYDEKFFKFTSSKHIFQKQRTLLIERQTCRIKQSQGQITSLQKCKKLNVHLIIGIIVIQDQPFLTLVTNTQTVAYIIRQPIYQIKDIVFIAFRKTFNEKRFNYLQIVKDLDGIRDNILIDNFYYCHNYNLTVTLQKRSQGIKMETMFFWNENMLKQLRGYGINKCWMIPIVQGYVKGFRAETTYIPYEYTMVTRRSKYQSGTRFISRGADSQGHVANFVETQQIFCFHRIMISWVILRGSVPLFWGQTGFGSEVNIVQSNNQTNILQKHFQNLQKIYKGQIVIMDLLSDKQGTTVREHNLQKKYTNVYKQMCNKSYLNFDLNQFISKNKSDVQTAIQKWVRQNQDHLCGDFFIFQHNEGNVIQRQTLFLRVNCLDCLDRTNVIQFKTSEKMVGLFQQYINENAQVEQKKIRLNQDFKDKHRQIWTHMGDRISLIYSGTTSVASYITKGQKSKNFFSSLGSGLKSLNRYYNANVNDTYKQQCIDWILRASEDTNIQYFNDNISLKLNQVDYCDFQQLNLTMITWNCAQVSPTDIDLGLLLEMPSQPDVIVICLQQVVELNTYNVLLGGSKNNQNRWRQSLEKIMKIHDKNMICIGQKDLVGVSTLVFVSQRYKNSISDIVWSHIKTGFKGNLGNKGAVAISFKFNDSIITVMNCHLEAGDGKLSQRLYSLDYINNNCFVNKDDHRQYQNSDFKFIVGDLNFRVDMTPEQVKQMLYQIQKQIKSNEDTQIELQKLLQPLLHTDQLLNSMSKHDFLKQFSQMPISFFPTYKYIKKSNQYDSKRTPSWCDRILYKSLNPLKLLVQKYTRKENVHYSDHKPVFGIFHLFVRNEDKNKKQKLFQQFMKW